LHTSLSIPACRFVQDIEYNAAAHPKVDRAFRGVGAAPFFIALFAYYQFARIFAGKPMICKPIQKPWTTETKKKNGTPEGVPFSR